MISQNKAEKPLNITSILNNFKSFIKQVYQKEWPQNINKKKGLKKLIQSRNKQKGVKTTYT